MDFAIPANIDETISLSDLFEKIAATGFARLALTANPQHCDYQQRTGRLQLIAYANQYKLVFDTLHVPVGLDYDITNKDSESRMGAVCNVANTMHAARVLGVRTVVLSATHALPNRHGSDTRSLLHALEGLIESAEIMGINLALRNLIDVRSRESLDAAMREYLSPRFGLCYDTALDLLADHEPYEILDKYGERLKAVLFADTDGKVMRNLPPFSGIVDWHRVSALLSVAGYQSPVTLNVSLASSINESLSVLMDISKRFSQMLLT